MKEPKIWSHQIKSDKIKSKKFNNTTIYYIELENIPWPYHIITDLCCGDRYAHIATGWWFYKENYRGSTSDDWHGGHCGKSLSEIIEWISEANHKEKGYSLWMAEK